MTTFGAVQAGETGFALEMTRLVGGAGGAGQASVAGALMGVPSGALSGGEMQTLLTVARQLTADGRTGLRDAQTLTHLIGEFASNGETALEAFWPFPQMNLANAPGNPLFNALAGYFGGEIGRSLNDLAFLSTADNLLDSAGGSETWIGALSGAIAHADLSKLSGAERSELISMLTVAVADGSVSWPEASAILDKLHGFLGTGGPSVQPMPVGPAIPASDWTVNEQGNGKATIDLGNYVLELNEHNSEIWITNKETGDKSRIWGDPHFDTDGDGRTDVDFWGTITLNLEDGTKITVNTTPWNGNKEMTLSSELIITKGDQAITVSGLDQNAIGDMSIRQSSNGRLLDSMYGDGLDLYENANGKGWLVQDGLWMREVTQADTDATKGKPGTEFNLLPSLYALNSLVSSSFLFGMLSSMFEAGNRR